MFKESTRLVTINTGTTSTTPMNQLVKQKRRQNLNKVISLRQVCPDSITVPLNYHSYGRFSAAYSGNQIFSLNSAYDPDYSSAGHQPLGFDQWSAFFNRYRVEKVHVEVDFVNSSTISNTDALLVANNSNSAISTQSTFFAGCEAPFSCNKLLPMTGNMNSWRVRRTYDIAQILGVTRDRYIANADYSATTSASPAEGVFLHLVLQDVLFNNNIDATYKIKITYVTTFFDRNQLAEN